MTPLFPTGWSAASGDLLTPVPEADTTMAMMVGFVGLCIIAAKP